MTPAILGTVRSRRSTRSSAQRRAASAPRRYGSTTSSPGYGIDRTPFAADDPDTADLALALAAEGAKVGILDADIYGPSQPRLMAAEGERPQAKDKVLLPIATRYGVPMLSMGQLIEPGKAIAWRGPMASNALGQLIDAHWGATDPIVVDLPPGTGDVQLTLIQKTPLDGAVIVSTPQEVALADARRAHTLFQRVNVPTFGLIENMSGPVFGEGGGKAEAERLSIPFLGALPLDADLREGGDAGRPSVATDPQGDIADRFAEIAARVSSALGL